MRIMPPANLPPRSSRAAAAHGRRGQRRRRRICACCFKVITKPDSRAQPESSFLPCEFDVTTTPYSQMLKLCENDLWRKTR